jgi:glycosyltransferase involved in cell wall biosynthesis
MNHYKKLSQKMRIKRKFIYSPYAYPDYLHPSTQSTRNNKTVSFLGSLTKEYGIYDFLEVAKDLVSENPMINVRIIGQGPEEQNSRNLVNSWNLSSNITFTGYIQESSLNYELSHADIFISPLRNTLQDFYRCPSKIYYYLAYQKPVVTCKFGEPQYALGDYGFYYEPGNIKSMNTAIKKALKFKGSPYPPNFIQTHSWKSRAEQIIKDLSS